MVWFIKELVCGFMQWSQMAQGKSPFKYFLSSLVVLYLPIEYMDLSEYADCEEIQKCRLFFSYHDVFLIAYTKITILTLFSLGL